MIPADRLGPHWGYVFILEKILSTFVYVYVLKKSLKVFFSETNLPVVSHKTYISALFLDELLYDYFTFLICLMIYILVMML